MKHPELLVRDGTTDGNILCQVMIENDHEIPIDISPSLIIDAGGCVGFSAIWYSKKYPNATIISIEPEYENFQCLEINTKDNPKIHCIHAGLSNKPGFLDIVDNKSGSWGFQTKKSDIASEASVRAITVDEILEEYGFDEVDLIKIDIEGGEEQLFSSDYGWLNKVDVMVIELHDFLIQCPDCSKNFYSAIKEYKWDEMKKDLGLILRRKKK